MTDVWWIAIGIVAAILGVRHVEDARRGNLLRPGAIAWSILAGWTVWEYGRPLVESGSLLLLVGGSLLFCALSPWLGYFLYGRNGKIWRSLLRGVGFVLVAFCSIIGWAIVSPRYALPAGLMTAVVLFLPHGVFARWIKTGLQRRRSSRELRLATAKECANEARSRGDGGTSRELQRRQRALERRWRDQDRRLAALERGEHVERARLNAIREEARAQVQEIREEEVRRIRSGEHGLVFHEHYGFLMAEAWRVVRSRLTVETDGAFFQVVTELLDLGDFERRFFHDTGREAIEAVNRYLAGDWPLSRSRSALEELRLSPAMLAPVPLSRPVIPTLLEAWLMPHRRRQDREWERYELGESTPELDSLLESAGVDFPTRETWRRLWDEHPHVFEGFAGSRSQ